MFELQTKTPVADLDGVRYRGLAYDGCYIYLTVHGTCAIIQLDDCFQRTEKFTTCRPYAAICYDNDQKCFWATSDDHQSTIYKLNKRMEEIDYIKVEGLRYCCSPINDISYNCCEHSLVVAFSDAIVQVHPDCPEKQVCLLKLKQGTFLRVLSLCPYLVCYCLEGAKSSICIYSKNGQLLHKIPVARNTDPEAIIFWPCAKGAHKCQFLVLYNKHGCHTYLCSYTLACNDVCNNLCECNYNICKPCPRPDPGGDACTDVLESIALVEAALAHILNAEGEKIQKVVASTDDVCKIMEVNESVNKTLNKVIFLEQILSCKLEILEDYCDLKGPPEPCE